MLLEAAKVAAEQRFVSLSDEQRELESSLAAASAALASESEQCAQLWREVTRVGEELATAVEAYEECQEEKQGIEKAMKE